MSTELETGAAASIGGLVDQRADRAGRPCENCGHVETAEHCPRCGQLQASFKRPLFSLIFEGIKDSFSLDGRLWRTFPKLWLRPGHLTRDYLDGKRARHVPPFRMFLLSSLIFFLTLFSIPGFQFAHFGDESAELSATGSVDGPENGAGNTPVGPRVRPPAPPEAARSTPSEDDAEPLVPDEPPEVEAPFDNRAGAPDFWEASALGRLTRLRDSEGGQDLLVDVVRGFGPGIAPVPKSLFTVAADFARGGDVNFDDGLGISNLIGALPFDAGNGIIGAAAEDGVGNDWFIDNETFDYAQMERDIRGSTSLSEYWEGQLVWLMTRIGRAYENPQLFENVLREWAPRVAFLQMPLFALFLAMLYFWRRGVFMYDHVITSLHLQSFFYQLTVVIIGLVFVMGPWAILPWALITPFYIYRQLRVGYGDGRLMAIVRTSLLLSLALVVLVILMVLLALAGLADMN